MTQWEMPDRGRAVDPAYVVPTDETGHRYTVDPLPRVRDLLIKFTIDDSAPEEALGAIFREGDDWPDWMVGQELVVTGELRLATEDEVESMGWTEDDEENDDDR